MTDFFFLSLEFALWLHRTYFSDICHPDGADQPGGFVKAEQNLTPTHNCSISSQSLIECSVRLGLECLDVVSF